MLKRLFAMLALALVPISAHAQSAGQTIEATDATHVTGVNNVGTGSYLKQTGPTITGPTIAGPITTTGLAAGTIVSGQFLGLNVSGQVVLGAGGGDGGSGTVTSVATSGAGITGSPNPIIGAGTLTVQWNAGLVNTVGSGLSLSGGTLTATGGGGGVTSFGGATGAILVGTGLSMSGQTLNATGGGGGTPANPTAQVSGSVVNGTATTYMRSDAAPALANTAVTPGSYTATNLTVDQQGRITAAANGTASATSITPGTTTINGATAPCYIRNSTGTTMDCAATVPATVITGSDRSSATAVTIATTDMGNLVTFTNNSGITQILPAKTTGLWQPGQNILLVAQGAGFVTLTNSTTLTAAGGCSTIPAGGAVFITANNDGATLDCTQLVGVQSGVFIDLTGQTTKAGTVTGLTNTQSGTTYTFVSTDCGKTVIFTSASAVTATIPASIVPSTGTACAIAVIQSGAGKVALNGTAVSAATLVSRQLFTSTQGTAGAQVALTLTTVGATATAFLAGDGS